LKPDAGLRYLGDMSEKPKFDPSQRLTIKRERFLFEYLKDGNATRSYRVAYDCDKASDKTIWNDAYKLLNKPEVAARLERLREQRAEVAALDKNTVLAGLLETAKLAAQCQQTGPMARCWELIGKAVAGGMFVDRSLVGEDTLSREQLIDQLSEGSEERRKLAERLLTAPRNFEEGANEATRKRFGSTGAG